MNGAVSGSVPVLFAAVALAALSAFSDMLAEPEGGPVEFRKTTAGADCVYRFAKPGSYSRDVTIVPPKGSMWYAFESCAKSADGAGPVVNNGRIIMPRKAGGSCVRIANSGTVPFIQKGAIETGTRLDVNGDVTLACPLRFTGEGEVVFADDARGRIQVGDGFSFGKEGGLAAGFAGLFAPGVLGKFKEVVAVSASRETINDAVGRLPPEWRSRCRISHSGLRAVVARNPPSPPADLVRKMPANLPVNRATLRRDGTAVLKIKAGTPLVRVRDEARAALAAFPGKPLVVSLAEGAYPVTETVGLSLVDSGTPSAPVTWRGEGGGAVLSGAVPLGAWRPAEKGAWRAKVPLGADGKPMWAAELFVDGTRRVCAAYPSAGKFMHSTNITENILAKDCRKYDYNVPAEHTFFLREEDFAHIAAISGDEVPFVWMRVHSKWNSSIHFVTKIDRAAKSVTIAGTRWPPWNKYKPAECPLRFENVRTELSKPGEWYYDARAGEIEYRPRGGETIAAAMGGIPCDGVDVFLKMTGDVCNETCAGHMRFENIEFRHGSTLSKKGPADVQDSLLLSAVARAMFLADGARDVVFDGCRWEQTGGAYCVWFREGCVSNAVVNCTFRDLGGGAVRVGVGGGIGAVPGLADEIGVSGSYPRPFRVYVPHSTAFITVENCLVERGGRYLPGAGAIFVGAASDCRIVHNRIDDLHYTAITCNLSFGYGGSPCQRCLVAFNRITRVGHGDLSDMGGVYMAGTGFGNVVARNVISQVDGMVYGGWGLYPDEGTEGVLYESNLVYDTKDGGIHQHFGRDNIVRNNIFAFSREGQVAVTRPEAHRSFTFEGNIIVWDVGDAFAKSYGTKSEKAIVDWRRNLWWRLDGRKDVFNSKTYAEWQANGRDAGGAFADPLFVDAAARDFRFRDVSAAEKIGFKPFDISAAGLYPAGRKIKPVYDTSYIPEP